MSSKRDLPPCVTEREDGAYGYQIGVPAELRSMVAIGGARTHLTGYIGFVSKSAAGDVAAEWRVAHKAFFKRLRSLTPDQQMALAAAGGIAPPKLKAERANPVATRIDALKEILDLEAQKREWLAKIDPHEAAAAGWVIGTDGPSLGSGRAMAAVRTAGDWALLKDAELKDSAIIVAERAELAQLNTITAKVSGETDEFGWDGLFNLWVSKTPSIRRRDKHQLALKLMRQCLGEMDYRKVTPHHGQRFLDWMTEPGQRISVPQQHHHRECVSGMFSYAVPLIMDVHPFPRSVKVAVKYQPVKKHAYEGREIRLILSKAVEQNYGGKRHTSALWILRLQAFMGCRVNEAAQIQRGDVTVKGGVPVIYFREDDAVTEKPRKEKHIKNGVSRLLPLHPALWDAKHPRYVGEDFRKFVGLSDDNGAEFVFNTFEWKDPSKGGKGRAEYIINSMGKFLRDTCKITRPNLQPNHAFRHRMNDAMINAGWKDEDERMRFLGQGGGVNRGYGNGESMRLMSKRLWHVDPLADD